MIPPVDRMGLFSKIGRLIGHGKAKDDRISYRIGNAFEDHVASMFDPRLFELTHRTPTDEEAGGAYVDSMVYPDLRFRERDTGKVFWVEVKYRSHAGRMGTIAWCDRRQLRNYRRTRAETRCPVLVIMGLGGTTDRPERVFCMDLDLLRSTKVRRRYYTGKVIDGGIESFAQLRRITRRRKPTDIRMQK